MARRRLSRLTHHRQAARPSLRGQAALEALDAAALESIYPAVPQGMLDALETYSTYAVELSDQPPVIAGDTATLGCRFPCA